MQQQQAVCVTRGQIQIVQHYQYRQAARGHFARLLQGQMLMRQIQRCGRLVQQQTALLGTVPHLRQHSRQMHALTLTAGQRQIAAGSQVADIRRRHGGTQDIGITPLTAGVRHTPHGNHFLDLKGKGQR